MNNPYVEKYQLESNILDNNDRSRNNSRTNPLSIDCLCWKRCSSRTWWCFLKMS